MDLDRDGADTKLIIWQLGARDAANAHRFIGELAERLANRVQLTTDGNRVYSMRFEADLGALVDYAMLIKQYGRTRRRAALQPGQVPGGQRREAVDGEPDMDLVSTSYASPKPQYPHAEPALYSLNERFQQEGRNARLQRGNHVHVPQLRPGPPNAQATPAVKAGIAKDKWTVEDMVDLLPLNVAGKAAPTKSRFQTDPLPKIRLLNRSAPARIE